MAFSWLIFLTIFHYGSYAKKQSNFMYDKDVAKSPNQFFYYPAARVSDFDNEYNEDEYYDDEYYDDEDYDDEYYNDDDISDYYTDTNTDISYNNDYNTQLYNQYLLNNYYNQMAYQNAYQNAYQTAYQNQMNRIYQSMLEGQQQRQVWEDINQQSINMDDYDIDLSELMWTDADDEFLKGFYNKMKKKALGWLEGKCTKGEENMKTRLEKCAVDYPPGEDGLKGIPKVGFKKISNVPGLKKEEFQKFFDHCVYQLDIFLETFVKYAEDKAYDKMGIKKVPMMRTLIDGFARALLEDDFSGVVDKVFMRLVARVADMNGLSAPKNFEIGDAPPPEPDPELFTKALSQFRYKDAFKKAIGWLGCKFLKILEYGKNKFWPTMKKGAISMIKRCGTNWFAGKLVDRINIYAIAAFDDMTKEVQWSGEMFNDWVKCLREKGKIDIKTIVHSKGQSLACVPKCFAEIDKKYNIANGLKKGATNAGKNAVKRAQKEVKNLEKKGHQLKDKLIKKGTEKLTQEGMNLIQQKIQNKLNQNSARRSDDDWYDYYEYEN